MEIVFLDASDPTPVYTFEHQAGLERPASATRCPARLDAERSWSGSSRRRRERFMALGCRDVARVDFRMDAEGRIYFIECNPLPGLAPGWSDLVLIAQAAGIEYRALIGEILAFAIRRYQERERERERARRAQAAAEREALARAAVERPAQAPALAGGSNPGPNGPERPSGTSGEGAPPV